MNVVIDCAHRPTAALSPARPAFPLAFGQWKKK